MRFLEIRLDAFGPFTGEVVDLTGGREGLHLIYGDNEAGKSSLLRALEAFLFGIPERTTDDFRHRYRELRVGARLRGEGGEELLLWRVKKRKGSLLDERGAAAEEAVLQRWLGGLSPALFTALWGLDHDRLEEGGEEILRGEGDLAESLFSAMAGGRGLRALLEELAAESGELFAPRGRNQIVPRALREYREAREEARSCALRPSRWRKLVESRDAAERELEEARGESRRKQREVEDLRRRRACLPVVARRARLEEILREAGDVPDLPEDFSRCREEAERLIATAQAALRSAEGGIESLRGQLEELEVDERLLERADAIEALYEKRGSVRKARDDRVKLALERDAALESARRRRREALPGAPAEDTSVGPIAPREKKRLRRLAREHAEVEGKLQTEREGIEKAERALERARRALEQAPEEVDVTRLEALLDDALRREGIDLQLSQGEAECGRSIEELRRRAARLVLWGGGIEDVVRLRLPSRETVERFETSIREAEEELSRLETRRAGLEDERRDGERSLREGEGSDRPPDASELEAARRERDALWRRVRRSWLEGRVPGRRPGEGGVVEVPEGAELEGPEALHEDGVRLAEAFESATGRADEMADRRQREAEAVRAREVLRDRLETVRQELARLDGRQRKARGERERIGREWVAAWPDSLEGVLSPREMRQWREHCVEIVRDWEQLRQRRDVLSELRREEASLRERLVEAVAKEPSSGGEVPLSELVARLRARVERYRQEAEDRRTAARDLGAARGDLERRRGILAALEKKRLEIAERWRGIVGPLGLGSAGNPSETLDVLDGVEGAQHKLEESEGLDARIRGIDLEAEGFAVDVVSLADRLGAPRAVEDPVGAAELLHGRLARERARLARREGLQENLEALEASRRTAREDLQTARERLGALIERAGASSVEELPVVESAARRAGDARKELRQSELQLAEIWPGARAEEIAEAVKGVDPGDLPGAIAAAQEAFEAAGSRAEEASGRLGAVKKELEGLDGNDRAAQRAEEASEALARARAGAERYARAKLAEIVLRRLIERAREQRRGPLLGRASELFSRLTVGGFEGLATEEDSADRPVLVGVRRETGERVAVGGMSRGTRDQLFLALRLAYLGQRLDGGERLPLLLDDLLVQFDDERSRAAIEVLGELSARTQVVFFTHHRRLVEIAQAALGEGVLRRVELRGGAARAHDPTEMAREGL